MSKIGVLGEAATASIGTTTVYIVPTSRAARIKLFYYGIAGASSTLSISVNGVPIFTTGALTATQASHTTTAKMHQAQAVASITGGTDDTTVALGPKEYYLAAGDTVTYTIGTLAFSSISVQVVGSEVEVS